MEKELCMSDTSFRREEKRKLTFRMSENKMLIVFVLIGNEHRRFLRNVKAIPLELRHAIVVADIN